MVSIVKLYKNLRQLDLKISCDHKRNLRMLVIACILNFSSAFEKIFIIAGYPLSDWIWVCAYGGLGIYLAHIGLHDYMMDLIEDNKLE